MKPRHLTQIEIVNFQSHRHSVLKLVPGVNIITGLEDSGKTAVLRAVNWVRTNRPSGDGFKHNKDSAQLTMGALTFADSITAVHTKQKSSNEYHLIDGHRTQDFAKVGRDVPRPVVDALQLEDINIQEQFDQPYLVWLTSGELANVFNRLGGMQQFEDWQAAVSSGIKEANAGLREAAANITAATAKLDRYKELPQVEQLIQQMQQCDTEVAKLNVKFNRLRQISASVKEQQRQLDAVVATEADCATALGLVRQIRAMDAECSRLEQRQQMLLQITNLADTISMAEAEYERARQNYLALLRQTGVCDRCYGRIDDAAISRIEENF